MYTNSLFLVENLIKIVNSFCNSLFHYFAFCFTSSVVCFLSTTIYVLLMQRDIYLNEKEHSSNNFILCINFRGALLLLLHIYVLSSTCSCLIFLFSPLVWWIMSRGKGYPCSLLNFYFPSQKCFQTFWNRAFCWSNFL